jgi:hypothetical protein
LSIKLVRYTRHARNRIRQHQITEEDVGSTVKEPDQLLPSIKSRYTALKQVSNRIIRVTFLEEVNHILVIIEERVKSYEVKVQYQPSEEEERKGKQSERQSLRLSSRACDGRKRSKRN